MSGILACHVDFCMLILLTYKQVFQIHFCTTTPGKLHPLQFRNVNYMAAMLVLLLLLQPNIPLKKQKSLSLIYYKYQVFSNKLLFHFLLIFFENCLFLLIFRAFIKGIADTSVTCLINYFDFFYFFTKMIYNK